MADPRPLRRVVNAKFTPAPPLPVEDDAGASERWQAHLDDERARGIVHAPIVPPPLPADGLIYLRRPVEAWFVDHLSAGGMRRALDNKRDYTHTLVSGVWRVEKRMPQWPPAPKPYAFAIASDATKQKAAWVAIPAMVVVASLSPVCDVCGPVTGAPATLGVVRFLTGSVDPKKTWETPSELCEDCANAIPHVKVGRLLPGGKIGPV